MLERMNRTAAAGSTLEAPDLADLSRFLVALGDPIRQGIVMALSRERLNVGQLAARFPLSRPAMSHHLKVLADAGLLVRERQGRERLYRLDVKRCRGAGGPRREFVLDRRAASGRC